MKLFENGRNKAIIKGGENLHFTNIIRDFQGISNRTDLIKINQSKKKKN